MSLLVAAAGISTLYYILAGALISALQANSISEFARVAPSSGSLIAWAQMTFGEVVSTPLAYLLTTSYFAIISGLIVASGWWLQETLISFSAPSIPWQVYSIFIALIVLTFIVGKARSLLNINLGLVVIQIVGLAALAAIIIARYYKNWNSSYVALPIHGQLGTSWTSAVPIAFFIFLGWENISALAPQFKGGSKSVATKIYLAIIATALIAIVISFTTTLGLASDLSKIIASPTPLVEAAKSTAPYLVKVTYFLGLLSLISALFSLVTSQANIINYCGLQSYFTKRIASKNSQPIPHKSGVILIVGATVIGVILGSGRDPLLYFSEAATLSALLTIIAYLAINLAIPIYFRIYRPEVYSKVKHLVIPIMASIALVYPIYLLVSPNQSAPFGYFGYILGILLIVGLGVGLYRRTHLQNLKNTKLQESRLR
ncbi:hypothetical protein AXFE_32610 [Acidithrix ferrooxidans]|uniref:Serine/threonine exchanger SteT n=1 Tax=Acidithrix ferrooxidans TaxID=1280514 RepID=A0A0D8HFT3_9ACTN|nr:hypothetical protein AXFE_32610 [Acidithrix ferrooxidans]